MGKMLDIPECDEADIYLRTLLNSLAARLANKRRQHLARGPHSILRRVRPCGGTKSPLIAHHKDQPRYYHSQEMNRPKRDRPCRFEGPEGQNERKSCQHDAGEPLPQQTKCGEAQEHSAHAILIPQ